MTEEEFNAAITEEEYEKQALSISKELREKRMRCSQMCGCWDYFVRACYLYGYNHPSPSRCSHLINNIIIGRLEHKEGNV